MIRRIAGKQIRRELLLYWRQPSFFVYSLLFFMMSTVFFPLSLPASPELLRQVAPGFIWISLLFANLLVAERLLQEEYDEGIIEQWVVSAHPLVLFVGIKMLIQWLISLLPLLLFCPFLALLFGFSWGEMLFLQVCFILGTPAMTCLCSLAAVFSAGMPQKGMLMALIVFPLTVPLLILGSSTTQAILNHLALGAYFALLLALSLFCLFFIPMVVTSIVRITLVD